MYPSDGGWSSLRDVAMCNFHEAYPGRGDAEDSIMPVTKSIPIVDSADNVKPAFFPINDILNISWTKHSLGDEARFDLGTRGYDQFGARMTFLSQREFRVQWEGPSIYENACTRSHVIGRCLAGISNLDRYPCCHMWIQRGKPIWHSGNIGAHLAYESIRRGPCDIRSLFGHVSGPLHLSMLTLADLTQANGGPPENDRIGSNNDSRDRGNVIVEPVNKMAQSPEEEREGGAVFFFGLLISLGIAWLYTTWPR